AGLDGGRILPIAICGAIGLMDGYDAQSMGYVVPALSADLHISRAALGPLLSSGLVGMVGGALVFGPIADRIGRKSVLIVSTIVFSLMSLATAAAGSLQMVTVCRLMTGFGLGGALPNTIALTTEFTPKKYEATAVTSMMCGFTLGAAFGGFVAAALISRFGWQSVFVVGGATPLLIAALAAWFLPKSVGFRRHQRNAFLVKELFREGRARVTILMWICFFMNLMLIFFLNSWLPTVINDRGIAVRTAILITSLFQVGGTFGAVILGRICDK